jgi:hypothetical protein
MAICYKNMKNELGGRGGLSRGPLAFTAKMLYAPDAEFVGVKIIPP